MEIWRNVWRNGIAPLLTTEQLAALGLALELDDPALVQGPTMDPPPIPCLAHLPVHSGCALAYCAWQLGKETVAEVMSFVSNVATLCDLHLGFDGARQFMAWFDNTSRDEMRRILGAEIDLELHRRGLLFDGQSTFPAVMTEAQHACG